MKHFILNSVAVIVIFFGSLVTLTDNTYAGRQINECCAGNGACCTCSGSCGANATQCWCN